MSRLRDATVGHRRRRIRVGLGALTAQTVGGTAAESGRALDALVRHAVTAEKSGFDSVWLSEHHFAEDGHLPSPLMVMGALARETTAVDLATNVAIGPLYDPLRLAEDVAVVDQLSGGRVILGLGLGYRPEEFAALGVDRSRRGRILETTVCTLRAAWSGEAVVTDGRTGHAVPVRPLPAQTGGPPILLGAFASRGVRRAARIADGWIAPELASVAQLARRIGTLELADLDRPFHIALTMCAFTAASGAWETVAAGHSLVGDRYRRWMAQAGDGAVPDGPGTNVPVSTRPDHVVAGTPEECVDQLRPWWELLRALPQTVSAHVTVRVVFPGVDDAATRESIRLLGTDVFPALAE